MPVLARAIMFGLAIFIAWTMVRAWRTGTVFTENVAYDRDERPAMFTLTMIAHGLLIAFCLSLAAGYEPAAFLDAIGVGWLKSVFSV